MFWNSLWRAAASPEMEFLDINLTKDLSLLIHAIHSPFYWRILQNTILFFYFTLTYENHTHSAYKNTYKKIHEIQKLSLFMNMLFEERKIRKKLESEKTQVMPRYLA
jgi:hypothetical protein